ncbi:MAG: S-layer homology domain-containing protein [Oscillospiraceae bacterium]|nr:S-layer homology domain-containing protein [Oscillospiraceae bacterium]
MRTLKKALCIVLALVMAVGLLTVAAGAKSLSDYSDAKKVAEQYKVAVDVNTQLGVLKGRTDTAYDPQGTLNRAELATIIYRIVTGDVEDAYVKNYADAQRFADVAPEQWFAGYVNYCADNGYLKGVGEGKYDPAGTLTGYQAMAALLRAIGYDKLHEYEGADWYVAVTKDAKKINEGIVADWAKPISREIAAQLAFNTLNAKPVMYVPFLGEYVESALGLGDLKPLLATSFGVTDQGIAYDAEGDPSYQYTGARGKVLVDMPLTPVATYTTKVPVCDMLQDAGIAKTDLGTYYAEFWVNGACVDKYEPLTHEDLDCLDWPDLDGQGVLTRVYDVSAYRYVTDLLIAQTYYYLAKVTKVTTDGHGVAGNVELEVYTGRGDQKTVGKTMAVADAEGYKKGDYVIVHPLFESYYIPFFNEDDIFVTAGEGGRAQAIRTWNVVIDQLAESFQGKRTDKIVDVDAGTVTYKIDGKEYNLDIDFYLSDTGEVVYKNVPFTWFFDLFGNLIGDIAVPGPAKQYTVIDRIAFKAMELEDGYAPAILVNMKAEKSQANVTSIDDIDVFNGDFATWPVYSALSQQWNQNYYQAQELYVINGTDLTAVEDHAYDVDITKGIATISLGGGKEIYGDSKTVYLYRTGEFGAYEYASYTGVTNAPTVVDCDIAYVANKNNYAEVIFVMVPPQPAQVTSGDFIVPEDLVPSQIVWINDNNSAVNYYVYTVYTLTGEPVQIKAITNNIESAPAGLYTLNFQPNGLYADDWAFLPGYFTMTVAPEDLYANGTFVDVSMAGHGLNQFEFVNSKIIVIGENGIKEITYEEAGAYLNGATGAGNKFMVKDSEHNNQSFSVVYIIPA